MQTVLWIIDGNNLIHRHERFGRILSTSGFAAARAFLEGELSRFRARQGRGHSMVIAYDGPDDGPRQRSLTKGLRVRHPSPGSDADAVVLDEVRRAEGRSEVHVVSSDRKDITGRLRGLRVQIHSVEEFVGMLVRESSRGTLRGATDDEAAAEKPPAPRGSQVDRWMREFGDPEDQGRTS